MGDILNNINSASNGTPYTGSVSSEAQTSQVNQSSVMGGTIILKHSLDSQSIMSIPMKVNEGAGSDGSDSLND